MSQWMITEDKLDDQQRQFIDHELNNNQKKVWINGFPGSGKSVLLVHSIHDILKKEPEATICVVVFTHSLIQLFITGIKELKIPEKKLFVSTYHKFKTDDFTYDYIFCDEVQDLPKSVLNKMKLRTKNLIVAGDSNQSIYKTDPQTNEPTVTPPEIEAIIQGKSWYLETIYRLSKSIIKAVQSFMPTMNILSAKKDKTKKDTSIRLSKARSIEKEVGYVIDKSEEAVSIDESSAIIMHTHDDIIFFINTYLKLKNIEPWEKKYDKYKNLKFELLNGYLESKKIAIEYVGNGYGSLYKCSQKGKTIIITYHSSKGLDFDNVFLPFLSSTCNIFDQTLFMVGLTRSKLNLTISYTDTMHKFVKDIENDCVLVDIDVLDKKNNDILDFDY